MRESGRWQGRAPERAFDWERPRAREQEQDLEQALAWPQALALPQALEWAR